jgi:hypothetical protein
MWRGEKIVCSVKKCGYVPAQCIWVPFLL